MREDGEEELLVAEDSVAENTQSIEYVGDASDDVLEFDGDDSISEEESVPVIEAMLLANGDALSITRISEVTGLENSKVKDALETIQMKYEGDDSGFELVEVAGQYQFRTKAEYASYIQALKSGKPRRLSHAALETLAIIAYRQPIVKSDIEKIRGVDATPTLKTLLDRQLIKIVGHKESVGQPALYGTGDEFLKLFGMAKLSDLPTLRDLKEIERDPGESATEGSEEALNLRTDLEDSENGSEERTEEGSESNEEVTANNEENFSAENEDIVLN